MSDFKYDWAISDVEFPKNKGKVFSCFSCGGGSTMGYKLAGFDVVGCNEIDPKMMDTYIKNHDPKHHFLEPIQEFIKRDEYPDDLMNLEILDGSPPCSSFSIAGNREKDWGKNKKFREGQAEQVLDTLFFDFIELAGRLRPKVVVAENVKGLEMGDSNKTYVGRILQSFSDAGYYVGKKLLNASDMGVPQKRERIFFYAIRKDLYNGPFDDLFATEPSLDLDFDRERITFFEIFDRDDLTENLSPLDGELWEKRRAGDVDLSDASIRERDVLSRFNAKYIYQNKVPNTVCGSDQCVLFDVKRRRNRSEVVKCGSFPSDYDFCGNKPEYIVGMSVPPLMTAGIAERISDQWLSKIDEGKK